MTYTEPLYFITGNKKKFDEIKSILPEIEQLDIDLPEMQEIDPRIIVRHKLQEAMKHHSGRLIVEDTSLYLDGLNGLPGPLIKWFMKTIGTVGLASLTEKIGNRRATAKTIIGYANGQGGIEFFEGAVTGEIVNPKGGGKFGWDTIFRPDGYQKTFAEMTQEEKNGLSMRRLAADQLARHTAEESKTS